MNSARRPAPDLSDLTCRYFLYRPGMVGLDVLVVAIEGTCRTGAKGDSDAAFMTAEILRGLTAFDPKALLLDLRGLDCCPGDALAHICQVVSKARPVEGGIAFPVLAVTPKTCREAVPAGFVQSDAGADEHYRDFEPALAAAVSAGQRRLRT